MADELRAAPWHGSRGGGAVNCDHEPWARSKQAIWQRTASSMTVMVKEKGLF
jgi:hypothetical protein